MTESITVDPVLLSLIGGAVIPLLVAFATKYNASSGTKAAVAALASVLAGVLTEIVSDGGVFSFQGAATSAAIALVASFSTYTGFWKPVVDVNHRAAPDHGLGSNL